MSCSSRNKSSRREYPDINSSSYGTHNDYPNESRPRPPHRERQVDDAHSARSSHRSYRSHVPHDGHRGYHPHFSFDNGEPRNDPVNGRRITVTSYRIPTNGEFIISYHESTTSHQQTWTSRHDRKGDIAYDSHRSSSGYRERLHIPSCSCTDCSSSSSSLSDLDDEDERSLSDRGKHHNSRSNDRREEDAKGNRSDRYYRDREQRHYQEGPKHSHPKEPKPTYTNGNSSKSKSYSNHRYTKNNNPGQGKPESGTSHQQNKPHSSRSESRCKENPRSKRSDPFNEDRGNRSRQEKPQSRAKEELPDHYATLEIGPLATEEEIKGVAKRRRVEVHPDKLKKPGMSASEIAKIDDEAAKVGQAADVLQNPKQRLEYDRKLYAANH